MAVEFDQLSPDQVNAVELVDQWFHSRDPRAFTLSGAAGTGKTTVARFIVERLGTTTQALAPTNRAARILRDKGVHGAKTIHSVLFEPTQWCQTENHRVDSRCSSEDNTRKHDHGVRFFKREDPPQGVRCFTIDECSMVGADIARDVAMFGVKTLAIGDPYQLQPVNDKPGYPKGQPGVELDSMHRFDSMSDIGKLANTIRLSMGPASWLHKLPYVGFEERDNYDLILAWRNATRWQVINMIRALRGLPADRPTVGDKLISVANTYDAGIYNADEVLVTGEPFDSTNTGAWMIPTDVGLIAAWKAGFRDYDGESWAQGIARRKGSDICALTFSECMTVNKAQGGEWERVLVVDDFNKMGFVQDLDPNTWAYTAVTRASKQVSFIKIAEFPTGMKLRRLLAAAMA